MGNCFSWCTQNKDCSSSSGRDKNSKGKGKGKGRGKRKLCRNKNSSKNWPSLRRKHSLSITSVQSITDSDTLAGERCESTTEENQRNADATVISHATPILVNQMTTDIETTMSNASIIVVQSITDESPSDDSRPITGSESNASLSHSTVVKQSTSNQELEEQDNDKVSKSSPPPPCPSQDQESPARNSHFQLLEFLKIRLDMAANNMEINRLLTNVDRALDRASRSRILGFKRMHAAAESRRAAREIQEETGTEEEGSENDHGDEGDEGYEEDNDRDETPFSSSTPPPIPRICWQ